MKYVLPTVIRILGFLLPAACFAANVSVNVSSNLYPVSGTAYGMHTSVYDNQNNNAQLPARLIESGVNTLRYSGGGYADVFHWSVNKLSPWQDGSYGYQGPNTDFGHFVGLLDNAHCQAVITVNFGSGQLWNSGHSALVAPPTNAEPQEAAAWVAYANSDASIYGTPNDITIGTDSIGNDWKTAGFWAKLRSSTVAQFNAWAGTTNHLTDFNFLAINHPTPVGIKYWEIGNETFGSGFYGGGNGYSVNYAVPYPYTNYTRQYNPALSPATYGQQVQLFSQAMKAVDPTIKIGAVVSTPLGDYSWDFDNKGQHWTPQVLAQCATNIDFVIAHWYFYNGNNDTGSSLLPAPAANIPAMINGTGAHAGTSSGLRDWIKQYRPSDPTNVSIFITEFGYTGSVLASTNGMPILGPVTALFDVDCYSTWMSYGVSNICFLEMNKTGFLGDSSSLSRGETFYGIELLHQIATPGDMFVRSTSDTSTIKAQATLQQNGKVGLLLLNESRTSVQTVNVTVSNAVLSTSGTRYQFGTNNFTGSTEIPSSPPSTNSISGLGNTFSITVPAYTMVVLSIPVVPTLTPTELTLVSSAAPSTYGSPVTFTATVLTNGNALGTIAGETVSFFNGSVQLGSGTLDGSGNAGYTTTPSQLAAGSWPIYAAYNGDASYTGSTNSPALAQTVNPAGVTVASGITADSKVYDGTGAATISSNAVTLLGVLDADSNSVSLSTNGYIAMFGAVNPGTQIGVTLSGLTLTGSSSSNYALAQPAGLTADILTPAIPVFLKPAISGGSGGWQLGFTGPSGQSYEVLATDDLTLPLDQWDVLATGTFGSGPEFFTDGSTNLPQRFYQIVLQ